MELIKNKTYDINGYKYEYLGFYIDYYDNLAHVFKSKKPFCQKSYKVGMYSDYDENILIKNFGLSKTDLIRVVSNYNFHNLDITEV